MEFMLMVEPHGGASYDDQLSLALAVQDLGIDGFFRSDHFLATSESGPQRGLTDTWTTLAGLARDTRDITLGSLVTSATFRLPGPLAVAVAQVDAMSAGRTELGIGAGWWESEHQTMGIRFPPTTERFDRLEEQLAVITGLWSTAPTDRFSFTGEHYRIENASGIRTERRAGPPIIIGGSGLRRTPELAARYAAEFNSGWMDPSDTAAQFARVAEVCRQVGRDPATIRKSTVQTICVGSTDQQLQRRAAVLGTDIAALRGRAEGITGSPAEAVDRIGRYAEAGVERLYLELLDMHDREQLDLIAAAVLPQIR